MPILTLLITTPPWSSTIRSTGPSRPLDHDPGRRLGIERDAGPAREVVAGPERDQAQDSLGKPAGAVECSDHGVQAAVPAGHDETAAVDRPDGVIEIGRT